MQHVQLRTLKEGDIFKRKVDTENVFIREHYNRKDDFGPASFCCSDWYDQGRCIQLKPSTMVFIDFDF